MPGPHALVEVGKGPTQRRGTFALAHVHPSKDNSQSTWCVINGTEKERVRDVGMRFVRGGRKVDNVTPT